MPTYQFNLIYIIGGAEICPSTHKKHIQSYVHFTEQTQGSTVLSILGREKEIWLRPANGTPKQNQKYCSKDLNFVEHGDVPDSDVEQRQKAAAKGGEANKSKYMDFIKHAKAQDWATLESTEQNASMYVRYHSAARSIAQTARHTPPDLPGVCGYWIYGPSGSGKSFMARNSLAVGPILRKDAKSDFFQGLNLSHTTLIWEEYDLHSTIKLKCGYLLKLIGDETPFEANVKNGGDLFRPQRVVITSNYTIDHCFPLDGPNGDRDLNESIHRRFHEVRVLSTFEAPHHTPMFDPANAKRPHAPNAFPPEGTWYSRFPHHQPLPLLPPPPPTNPVRPLVLDLTRDEPTTDNLSESADFSIDSPLHVGDFGNESPCAQHWDPNLNTQESSHSSSEDLDEILSVD